MNLNRHGRAIAVGLLAAPIILGCDRSSEAPTSERNETAVVQPTEPNAGHVSAEKKSDVAPESKKAVLTGEAGLKEAVPPGDGQKADGEKLALEGIVITVPAGWTRESVAAPGPMSPRAVFKIPNDKGEPGIVRITHFPNMKGKEMDDRNIDRWVSQVIRADGSTSTRDDANIQVVELEGVRLTMLDLTGKVTLTMRDTPKEGWRMIAAIVDHAQGPHFVVAAGPTELMKGTAEPVFNFLKSAKTK